MTTQTTEETPTPPPSPSAAPEWMGSLGDETLRTSETLSRYKSVDDLAKGHIETMSWARGRIPIPAADDAKGREDFIGKVRPEKWENYEVAVPEGSNTDRADAFKQKAHQLGLLPWQAKELSDWSNGFEADAVSKMTQTARDELTTREINIGPAGYQRTNEAIASMFNQVEGLEGFDSDQVMRGMESAFGAGQTWDFLRWVASKTGELDKVDGGAIDLALGNLKGPAAQAEINRLMKDSEFMEKAKQPGSPESKRWKDLNLAASKA
ncbi:hypothetical protein [Novosphingobium sp. ST904]|uniref:hypothetical protein n=1 Tax=Novosphingobium sp. ST904 TaxID=1684385 RepID=UPI0006CDE868|nr:hypothetical protein [Novosphingobium sp. ST904]KPH59182.1 hypothetical protein ADT71_23865 [Novosphingobium sp. ST904]TCM37729.1 hypothetical protein EDF59_110125 [Novosphingobium sp. ST904]